jgi:DDE superfamily endonuclease
VGRFLARERKGFKRTVLPAEQVWPGVARRRRRWIHYRDRIDPRRICLHRRNLDQDRSLAAGYAGREADHPCAAWTLAHHDLYRRVAPRSYRGLDSPVNAEACKTYVRAELVRTLKPDDIAVLDNLNNHQGKAVRVMVKAIGARLFFLPSYSPDLNPSFGGLRRPSQKSSTRCERLWADASKPSKASLPKPSTPSHPRMLELPPKCRIRPKCETL